MARLAYTGRNQLLIIGIEQRFYCYLYNNIKIREIMKKSTCPSLSILFLMLSGLFYPCFTVKGQESAKESPALPEEINKIVTTSCMPCHTSDGGFMSRQKLNFTEWTKYSVETQKKKAAKMYSMLKKDSMPPKSARETRPDIVPTREQIEIIRKWSESFDSDDKK
jgi:hypothetical protein